ncbi:tetratricopeptide repeat protein [Litorihabitans aurantiacus]|uniref:Tetratricopeptide repeat protein n=1 Tax=Litorihabitans aurantiacus TaxID=1930061 RepID=A0AA37XEF4_9MICO|nr:tetratricopeptide repeat protein [Litorihabitans aurantiacus]GMA31771.1 hypothetical protein GCM10025875_17630 [Litorihabitans aurantiacus]
MRPLLARRTGWAALALVALLGLYVVAVGERGVLLLRTGEPVAVALGAAVLVIPLLTVWFLVREIAQARAVDRLTRVLAGEGTLEVDDLPRSPAGRIDRAVADERFEPAREAVQADPDSWRAWYRLGWAYDAAGDRRRAREALRRAVRLERAARR